MVVERIQEVCLMARVLLCAAEDDLSTTIATLVMAQEARRLPLHYRPCIGMIAAPTLATDGHWPVMGADGGDVRLLPLRLPARDEDAVEMVLNAVLPFDGLLFAGSASDVDPRLYGQRRRPCTSPADALLDFWIMLIALVARETLTPLFGICGGAERLNVACGGSLCQHIPDHQAESVNPGNWMQHTLDLDVEALTRCIRGAHTLLPEACPFDEQQDIPISCMHHQAPDRLAPGFVPWGWSEGITEGFGYAGRQPWFAVATLFHLEAPPSCQTPLSGYLMQAFLAAARAYSASLRDALKATRMRDRMLRRLYADPLVQRLLQGPPGYEVDPKTW
jgi:gamma-glutamyl-gamma-aminobutyrate hydrolase PuuD